MKLLAKKLSKCPKRSVSCFQLTMKAETKKKLRLFMLCYLHVLISMVGSMQAPFYPKEASRKGLVPSQYGFVFGIFQILFFIFSLIYGKYMTHIGISTVNLSGMVIEGVTCFSFGFVHLMYDSHFYAFSLIIRMLEGIGNAAFVTSSCAIIAAEFIENINFASSIFVSSYGVGLVIGPVVGGALYELGGFIMPFALVGLLIIVSTIIFVLTVSSSDNCMNVQSLGIFSLLKFPSIFLCCVIMFGEYFTIGMLDATLEPHLRSLELSSVEIGVMFFLLGLTFSASSPAWGYICDRWPQPKIVCMLGSLNSSIMFLFIGPAPFLRLEKSIYIEAPILIMLGVSLGAIIIGTYSSIRLDAIKYEVIKPSEPNSLISGVWICAVGIGSFSGASFGGILFDEVGFPWTSVGVAAFHFILMVITLGFILAENRQTKQECEKLLSSSQTSSMPLQESK